MTGWQKIVDGLKAAIVTAKCEDHDWPSLPDDPDKLYATKQCPKCGATFTVYRTLPSPPEDSR